MMINMASMIQQANTLEELKPILILLVKTVNTLHDAKNQIRGDTVYHDGGMILRCDGGNYHRVRLTLNNGVPSFEITDVGQNPTGD